jgi:hypothetical protein
MALVGTPAREGFGVVVAPTTVKKIWIGFHQEKLIPKTAVLLVEIAASAPQEADVTKGTVVIIARPPVTEEEASNAWICLIASHQYSEYLKSELLTLEIVLLTQVDAATQLRFTYTTFVIPRFDRDDLGGIPPRDSWAMIDWGSNANSYEVGEESDSY